MPSICPEWGSEEREVLPERWTLEGMTGRYQELAVRQETADGKLLSLGMLLPNSEVQASKSEALVPGRAPSKCPGLCPSLI